MADDASTLLLCARVKPGEEAAFGQWQASWQSAAIASGAESVEFWPPAPPDQLEWVAVARFPSLSSLQNWRRGEENRKLVDQVTPLAEGGVVMQLAGQAPEGMQLKNAKLGGIFNMGGAAVANYVSVLEPLK